MTPCARLELFRAAGTIPEDKAREAAEEVASYENRLTQLTTLSQAIIALLLVVLGSQAALWLELGKINGTLARVDARIAQLNQPRIMP